jgi:hypothetical protein
MLCKVYFGLHFYLVRLVMLCELNNPVLLLMSSVFLLVD